MYDGIRPPSVLRIAGVFSNLSFVPDSAMEEFSFEKRNMYFLSWPLDFVSYLERPTSCWDCFDKNFLRISMSLMV